MFSCKYHDHEALARKIGHSRVGYSRVYNMPPISHNFLWIIQRLLSSSVSKPLKHVLLLFKLIWRLLSKGQRSHNSNEQLYLDSESCPPSNVIGQPTPNESASHEPTCASTQPTPGLTFLVSNSQKPLSSDTSAAEDGMSHSSQLKGAISLQEDVPGISSNSGSNIPAGEHPYSQRSSLNMVLDATGPKPLIVPISATSFKRYERNIVLYVSLVSY